jgi:hypothetical protein
MVTRIFRGNVPKFGLGSQQRLQPLGLIVAYRLLGSVKPGIHRGWTRARSGNAERERNGAPAGSE